MHIDWAALGIVAVVAITATLIFMTLLAGGIRLVSVATVRTNLGESATTARTGGYLLLGAAGLVVLYGIYLIVPFFH